MPQIKCLPLQEYQQLCLDLDRRRREAASLGQKLCYARRNLEEEKRKRRVIEHHKNLLVSFVLFMYRETRQGFFPKKNKLN